jgi:hypothetical protein
MTNVLLGMGLHKDVEQQLHFAAMGMELTIFMVDRVCFAGFDGLWMQMGIEPNACTTGGS